jgi:hypothetical protein
MMATEMIKTGTAVNFSRLKELERVIERGKQTFVDVGLALAEIRDSRLYRKDFSTFEEYCQSRWGWNASRSRQLISSAQAVSSMESVTAVTLGQKSVESERHARELSKVKNPVLRSQVWREVTESAAQTNTQVTTNLIKETVDKYVRTPSAEKIPTQTREADGMDIVQKLSLIRKELTPSQKIFDIHLQRCVRDIRHSATLTDEQREEVILSTVEKSCAHSIQEISEDSRLAESEVKTIVHCLVNKEILEEKPRLTIGGSSNQTLIFSRRNPCGCV